MRYAIRSILASSSNTPAGVSVILPERGEEFPYDREFIANYALDHVVNGFDYMDGVEYLKTPVDLESRDDEIVGATQRKDGDCEDIYFEVKDTLAYEVMRVLGAEP